MTAIVNGIQYIGGGTAPNEFTVLPAPPPAVSVDPDCSVIASTSIFDIILLLKSLLLLLYQV